MPVYPFNISIFRNTQKTPISNELPLNISIIDSNIKHIFLTKARLLADRAYELYQQNNTILNYYIDYLRLARMDGLVSIYKDLNNDWPVFIHLYKRIKKEALTKQEITDL